MSIRRLFFLSPDGHGKGKKMIQVAPSILSADFAHLGRDVENVCKAGADLIHVDVMDGHFVPNLTFGPMVVRAIKPYATVPLDVHLMMTNPQDFLAEFIDAGADQLTLHAEVDQNILPMLQYIRSRGVKTGLSLRPRTPASILENYLPFLDLVLVMTVEPGFGGQDFLITQLPKIALIHSMIDPARTIIQVDGGINAKTAPLCIDNGASTLIAGSSIFKAPDWKKAIDALRRPE